MFAKELRDLAERRRLLVMESDLHRGVIGMECASLRERVARVQQAREHLTTLANPVLIGGGALAGFLALRNWRRLMHWVPTLMTAARWMLSLRSR
jgi:hypothetical protein